MFLFPYRDSKASNNDSFSVVFFDGFRVLESSNLSSVLARYVEYVVWKCETRGREAQIDRTTNEAPRRVVRIDGFFKVVLVTQTMLKIRFSCLALLPTNLSLRLLSKTPSRVIS